MTISEYINSAWTLHATSPEQVLAEMKDQFKNIETEDDILKLAHLIVHVSGEHLGKWQTGLELLRKLKNNSLLKKRADMQRFVAILELGNNPNTSIEKFSSSDQARILATTGSALISLGGLKTGELFLKKASVLAEGFEPSDPANMTLAMNANNVASSLEEKSDRSAEEAVVMIDAAKMARVFWEKAGTWKEVERAEYRLGQSYLQAQQFDLALKHADLCLKIVNENHNEPLELFFALELRVLIFKAMNQEEDSKNALTSMRSVFNGLTPEDQSWCKEILTSLEGR